MSSLTSHNPSLQVFFRKPGPYPVVSIYHLDSSAFIFFGVRSSWADFLYVYVIYVDLPSHRSPITPSTFIQAFAPAVIHIVAKARDRQTKFKIDLPRL